MVVVAAVLATVLTVPASAALHRVTVQLPDGTYQQAVLDLPAGITLEQLVAYPQLQQTPQGPLPGTPVWLEPLPPAPSPAPPAPAAPAPKGGRSPSVEKGHRQRPGRVGPRRPAARTDRPKARPQGETRRRRRDRRASRRSRHRRADGAPSRHNPGLVQALPGPSRATGVPDFVIRKFRVPVFLLPIYQAAGAQYGIKWELLAAINEIETDYGRNLNVSSAGALGWMQFMPASWRAYGVDANNDGKRDPYNPVDAIFAAARYLKAAGYDDDVRRAVFAYNHADWYVDSVMLRARLIAGAPADLIGSLTGLTEGRFPVDAPARYADDLSERGVMRQVASGGDAAAAATPGTGRRGIEIYSRAEAPAVAVSDGVVKKIGRSRGLGRYLVLPDVYGNRYTYGRLGSVGRFRGAGRTALAGTVEPVRANGRRSPSDRGGTAEKRRVFAHPELARDPATGAVRRGSRVSAGTPLGKLGRSASGKAAHLYFEIRPAGRGAPRIDPKPILDGWKLLEATALDRASGRNALRASAARSPGQILLLPKPLLERRVLSDSRIDVYPCGRKDIRAGRVDRRVLATLAYLAESGLRPTVTSLKCGHGFYTSSGNVSHHSSGNAVDISKVNGIPVLGHQEPGGVTAATVRQLLRLQGAMRPAQIISLLEMGGSSFAMSDHADHIHVGFSQRFGTDRAAGRQTLAVLRADQWSDLVARLRQIPNPAVPAKPSRFALPSNRGD